MGWNPQEEEESVGKKSGGGGWTMVDSVRLKVSYPIIFTLQIVFDLVFTPHIIS